MKRILLILLLAGVCHAQYPLWTDFYMSKIGTFYTLSVYRTPIDAWMAPDTGKFFFGNSDSLHHVLWSGWLRNIADTTTSLTSTTLITDSILGGPAGGGTYIAWQGISGSAAQVANYGNGYGLLYKNYSTVGSFSTWENNSKTQGMIRMTLNDTSSAPGSCFYFDDGGFPSLTGGTELVFGRITRSNQICYGTYVDSGRGYYVDVGHNGMGAMWESNDNATSGSILNYFIQDWTGGGRGRMVVASMQGNPAIPFITVSGDGSYGDSCMIYRWGMVADTGKFMTLATAKDTCLEVGKFTRTCTVDTLSFMSGADSLTAAYIAQGFWTRGTPSGHEIQIGAPAGGLLTVWRLAADTALGDRWQVLKIKQR